MILNQDHSLLLPNSARQRLHSRQLQGSLLPQLPVGGLSGWSKTSAFLTLPPTTSSEATSLSMIERWGLPSAQLPLMECRLYLGCDMLRTLGSWSSLPWFIKQWFCARRGKPRGPHAAAPHSPTSTRLLEWGCYLERSLPSCPTQLQRPGSEIISGSRSRS